MPVYRAPLDDYRFLFSEFLDIGKSRDLFGDVDPDMVDDVLAGATKFSEQVLQPLNLPGDEEGCRFENGAVRTPAGFKEAYQAFCAAGWPGLIAPVESGGSGMPVAVAMAAAEMASSANQSFAMYPGLSAAATAALIATGAPWMKLHVVPKLVSGAWTGTMCLTESGCGTDLKLMKTRAVEQPDGSYRMTGTKIFISGGDHDLTDNIIHMVIAKIPDANGRLADDLATVNFFMVPKFVLSEDGRMGGRNGVTVGGIEKKMGIKAQSTCVLNFDEAVCWRLGPKPSAGDKRSAGAGMAGMFGMMNAARLGVGLQGLAIAEVAIQNAEHYVHERRQGRAPSGAADPAMPADLLVAHPDIKRMILHGRAFADGARALMAWTGFNVAVAASARPDAEQARLVTELLTPVIKAYFTDMGFEVANLALQCFGGHGYIREHGVEQFVRDARINMIYEGANGVQAMDLVTRRLPRHPDAAPALFAMIACWLADNGDGALAPFTAPLQRGLADLQAATTWLSDRDANDVAAAATDYLKLMGVVSVGWMWARMAKLAHGKPASPFHRAKLTCAKYWMERVMPETALLHQRMRAGSATLMEIG